MKINARIKFAIFIILLVAAIIILWKPLLSVLASPDKIKEFVSGFGVLAPIIFIALVAAQIIFAPIPGQAAGLAGGYVFGVFLGTLYSLIGLIIGSFIVFILARKFGRPFVEKVVDKKTLEKFDSAIQKRGLFFLFLIYLLPALPDDAVSYLAGLTEFKIRTLVIISAIGRLPGFIVLSLVGAGIASSNSLMSIIIFISMIIVSLLIFWKRNEIERLMTKFAGES